MRTISGKPLGVWEQVTEEAYDFALGAVPPLMMRRYGFILGEPYSITPKGEEVWYLYWEHAGKHWRTLTTSKGWDVHTTALQETT